VLVRVGLRDHGPAATKPQPAKTTKVGHAPPAASARVKRFHVVRAGDTLASISARTGVSVARLRQLNPTVEPTSLFIGDKLRLR
jgi:LysM repeat protein